MKNKGFTLVEMLVTFVILSIIVVIMTNILFKVKETSEKTSELTEVAMFQANVTRIVLKDLNSDTLDSLVSCGNNCYTLTYDNLGVKELSISGNTITYGDYVKDAPKGAYIGDKIIIENDYVSSVVGSNNSILGITIPVGNYYNSKDYNIKIDFQYDSSKVYIENITAYNSYQYQNKLTIDHTKIDSDLTNFPVTVKLNNGNFDYTKLTDTTNYYDLRFVDGGGNPLAFEREIISKTTSTGDLPEPTTIIAPTGSSYFNKNVDKYEFRADRDGQYGKYLEMVQAIDYASDFDISFKFKVTGATFTSYGSWATVKIGTNTDIPTGHGSTEGFGFVLWYDNDFASSDNVTFDFEVEGFNCDGVTGSKYELTTNSEYTFRAYQTSGTIYMELRDNTNTVVKSYNYSNSYTGNLKYVKVSNLYIDSTTSWFTGEMYGFDFLTVTGDVYNGVYHVKLPTISSTVDTDFYVQYNKEGGTDQSTAEAVWDSNYVMVQHMGDSLLDSTSNNNNLTNGGTISADGFNGKARDFDGNDDYIETPTFGTLFDSGSNFTVSTYLSFDNFDSKMFLFHPRAERDMYMLYNLSTNELRAGWYNSSEYLADYTRTINANEYHMLNYVVNSNVVTIFEDQLSKATYNGYNPAAVSDHSTLGNQYGSTPVNHFNGKMDEVRISNVARSDAWLKAEYNTLADTLLTYGPRENT